MMTEAASAAAQQHDADLAAEAGESAAALTAAEQAYFATRGESGLPMEAEPREQADLAAAKPQGEPPRVKTVPHGALHAEREEHKKTRAELQKMRAQALDRQRELAGFQQRSAPQNPQNSGALAAGDTAGQMPPDPREDFLGFARWQGLEISRLNQELTARQHEAAESQRAAALDAAIMQEWENAVREARREAPDIDAALEFLEAARLSQLKVLAQIDPRFADKNFCEKQIGAELRDIIIGTFQQGKNPANAVYDIARAYGYGRDETARMGKLQEAAQSARSLTAGAGGETGDPQLLETVANMPEAEFAQWYERNKASFRQMFGG